MNTQKRVEEKFTKTEIQQIESYARERERVGWYYGNKEQFEKRHQSIINKLQTLTTNDND